VDWDWHRIGILTLELFSGRRIIVIDNFSTRAGD